MTGVVAKYNLAAQCSEQDAFSCVLILSLPDSSLSCNS